MRAELVFFVCPSRAREVHVDVHVWRSISIFETIPFCWVRGSARAGRDVGSAYLRRAKVSRQLSSTVTSLHLSSALTTATMPFAHVMSASYLMLSASATHALTATPPPSPCYNAVTPHLVPST